MECIVREKRGDAGGAGIECSYRGFCSLRVERGGMVLMV